MGTMTYLATVTTFLTGLCAVAAIVFGASLGALPAPPVRRNHTVRINRQESIPTYHRGRVSGPSPHHPESHPAPAPAQAP